MSGSAGRWGAVEDEAAVATNSEGLRIRYSDDGVGETALLFLPGWCASRSVFDGLVSRASRLRRCLALDWRGHGESEAGDLEFGNVDLLDDALAVVASSGVRRVVPVAQGDAGWVAVEMRRRLGRRVPALVLLDWLVTDPPAALRAVLEGLQSLDNWRVSRDRLVASWLAGAPNPELGRFVREDLGHHSFPMWSRAAREIARAYRDGGSPLRALGSLVPPAPVLHLYAQPDDEEYIEAQRAFAARHPWLSIVRLEAKSHFPMFEVPDAMVSAIERFVSAV